MKQLFTTLTGFTCILLSLTATYAQTSSKPCESGELNFLLDEVLLATEKMQYDVAIEKAALLVKSAVLENENEFIFHGYNLLSINHFELQDTVHSLEYSRRALIFAKQANNDTLIAWGYNNLAAGLAKNPKTRSEALELYKKSLTIAESLDNGKFLDAALNLAELYRDEGKYELMKIYLKKAEGSYDKSKVYFDDPLIHLSILWGDYYSGRGDLSKSYSYYETAYDLIEKNKMQRLALDFYDRYATMLAQGGQFNKAFEINQKYLNYYKNLENTNARETVQLAQAHAEADELRRLRDDAELKQQLAFEKLDKKKTQSILFGIIVALLIVFLFYLFYSVRKRKELIFDLQENNKALLKANEVAEKSVKAKTKFFSTLSHEMRTPLYGVTGIISLLERNPEFRKYSDDIRSLKFSADHLLEIINDLLDLSKLEDNSFELQIKPFNIKLLTEELVASFDQYSFQKEKCEIVCNIDPQVPNYVMGDSRRISQVLLNILSNAIKFTSRGKIWLRLKSESLGSGNYRILFEIEDTGVGIAPDKIEHIFTEFSQLNPNEEEGTRGTGLGLPIVKKLLEKMNSTIHLQSIPGKGSLFSFYIEFKEATLLDVIEYGANAQGNPVPTNKGILQNASILIVDDNKLNRLVTKKVLENQQAITSEAVNGEQALELVKNNHYDLILMDINMPGMNGFETTDAIRTFDKDIPIIALTAADAGYIEKKIHTSGMNGAIIKPYSMQEFLSNITNHLGGLKKTTG